MVFFRYSFFRYSIYIETSICDNITLQTALNHRGSSNDRIETTAIPGHALTADVPTILTGSNSLTSLFVSSCVRMPN